jgi:N4-gp56 family major capsid protein
MSLSKKLRHAVQPLVKFRQFCDVKDATQQGKSKGDTFHWNVYSDIATQGTTLLETNTMPQSNFTITQGTLTITEGGNSVPYTGKLDDLSEHPVKQIVNKVLKHDAKKFFDIQSHAQFDTCLLRAYSLTGSTISVATTGTVGGTGSTAFNSTHAKLVVDTMKERNIPPYVGDDYYVSTPKPGLQ